MATANHRTLQSVNRPESSRSPVPKQNVWLHLPLSRGDSQGHTCCRNSLSRNPRITGAGRDLWGSPGPNPSKQFPAVRCSMHSCCSLTDRATPLPRFIMALPLWTLSPRSSSLKSATLGWPACCRGLPGPFWTGGSHPSQAGCNLHKKSHCCKNQNPHTNTSCAAR